MGCYYYLPNSKRWLFFLSLGMSGQWWMSGFLHLKAHILALDFNLVNIQYIYTYKYLIIILLPSIFYGETQCCFLSSSLANISCKWIGYLSSTNEIFAHYGGAEVTTISWPRKYFLLRLRRIFFKDLPYHFSGYNTFCLLKSKYNNIQNNVYLKAMHHQQMSSRSLI